MVDGMVLLSVTVRVSLAVVFFTGGLTKLPRLPSFWEDLAGYDIFSPRLGQILAPIVPGVEVGAAISWLWSGHTAIAVVHQSAGRTAMLDRHVQGPECQRGVERRGRGPAHHASAPY